MSMTSKIQTLLAPKSVQLSGLKFCWAKSREKQMDQCMDKVISMKGCMMQGEENVYQTEKAS